MVTTSTWSTPNRTEKMTEEIRQEIGNVAPEVAMAVRNASVKIVPRGILLRTE